METLHAFLAALTLKNVFVAIVTWFTLGYISACVRFGTWKKNPIVFLLLDGWAGDLKLRVEILTAIISGPFVALKIVANGICTPHPIGFAWFSWRALNAVTEP